MNILSDGTLWVLPPRTGTRFTAAVLWKYGLVNFAGHQVDTNWIEHDSRIIMNVRNPFTRVRSWWRIYNDRLSEKISCEDYILNLHGDNPIRWEFTVESLEDGDTHSYVIPLHHWVDTIRVSGAENKIELCALETIQQDLEKLGYPDKSESEHDKSKWEDRGSDHVDDIRWYRSHPKCAEIVRVYYAKDFELFNYSDNLNRMYHGTGLSCI